MPLSDAELISMIKWTPVKRTEPFLHQYVFAELNLSRDRLFCNSIAVTPSEILSLKPEATAEYLYLKMIACQNELVELAKETLTERD